MTEHLPLDQLLVRAGQAAHSCTQRAAAAHGLTATALGVLGVLAQGDAVSHRELAGRLGVTPATLTPLVDDLEAAGAIVRARDRRDRRMVRVSITPAGRERFAAASEQVARDVGERLPRPAPADAAVVRAYLLAVLAAVGDGPGPE